MEIFKVIGMYTDKRDESLGISYISKGAFKKMKRLDAKIVGIAERKDKVDKKGNPIVNTNELLGVLEVSQRNANVYKANPSSFIGYVQVGDNDFLKIVK